MIEYNTYTNEGKERMLVLNVFPQTITWTSEYTFIVWEDV